MAEAKAGGRVQIDPTSLGAIVAHPIRSKCLTLLADRVASPIEMANELGEGLGTVAYHVRALNRAGVIELVDERPVRGSTEHFYRAVIRPWLKDTDIAEIPLADRQTHAKEMLSLTTANASASLDAGTMCDRDGYHLSRLPMNVDQRAWEELHDLYEATLERAFEIQYEASKRLGAEDAGFPVVAFQGFFEMPAGHHGRTP